MLNASKGCPTAEWLTIVIPTRNRVPFLRQLLRYYAEHGCQYPIVIGDSSDDDQVALLRAVIRQLDGRLSISHHRYPTYEEQLPGIGTVFCMHDMLQQHVATRYVVFVADDDFIIPAALEEAVQFLEQHPNYSTVYGKAALVVLPQQPRGQLYAVEPYPQRAIPEDTAVRRFENHFHHYITNEYSVKRTAQAAYQWQVSVELEMDDQLLGELLRSGLGVIQGKTKLLNRLYMVRQGHKQMTSARSRDPFERLVSPTWPRHYERFRRCLATALQQQDGVPFEAGLEIVKEAFWAHMVPSLARRRVWPHWPVPWRYQHPSKLRRVLREMALRYPVVWRLWWRLRLWLPTDANAFSLPALLRPSSPSHAEFMPIYRAIAAFLEAEYAATQQERWRLAEVAPHNGETMTCRLP